MTRARDVANIDGLLTTTGDTYYASAAGTPARLGIGSTDQVLKVSGGVPTWATPSSGSTFVGVSLYKTNAQATSNNTETTLVWEEEDFDTDAFHSTVSNTDRITIPTGKTGKHLLTFTITVDPNGTGGRIVKLQKNGTDIYYGTWAAAAPAGIESSINSSVVLNLDAADYLEVLYFQNSGGGLLTGTGAAAANLQITYLGA